MNGVLLVDEDMLLLRSLRRILQPEFHVVLATTTTEAVAALRAVTFCAVVVDRDLQPNGGRHVLEKARLFQPAARRILMAPQAPLVPPLDPSGLYHAYAAKSDPASFRVAVAP